MTLKLISKFEPEWFFLLIIAVKYKYIIIYIYASYISG